MAAGIEDLARRIGHYVWTESMLFEVLGGWATEVPEPDVKVFVGTHCHRHAWHAELWRQRLPELRELDPQRLIVPANDEMARFADTLVTPQAPEQTVEKLAGVYRVLLPRCVSAYTSHRDLVDDRTDAPTGRVLDLVLRDQLDEWRDGELLLQSLLATADDVARATAHQAELEALIVTASGITGPDGDAADGVAPDRPG